MNDAQGKSLILRFYNTAAGELVCRITDAFTHESWLASDAAALLQDAQNQRNEGKRALDSAK